jgi:hypothetical protein
MIKSERKRAWGAPQTADCACGVVVKRGEK